MPNLMLGPWVKEKADGPLAVTGYAFVRRYGQSPAAQLLEVKEGWWGWEACSPMGAIRGGGAPTFEEAQRGADECLRGLEWDLEPQPPVVSRFEREDVI